MSVADVVSQMGLGALPPIYDPNSYSPKLSPFKDFYPPDSLFHAYLWWASEVAYSTPLYHIGVLLPMVCHEATRRGYRLETSEERLRIWTCLLGGSSSGKSTCSKMGRKFYEEYLQKARMGSYVPPFHRLTGTKEGVRHALQTDYFDPGAGRVLAILENDEVTGFLPRNGGTVTEALIQMYDGEEIIDHTRTSQREAKLAGSKISALKDYTVQGLFATTPAALDESTNEGYFTGGLFPRLLWIHGRVKAEDIPGGQMDPQTIRRATALAIWEDWDRDVNGYETKGGVRVIRTSPEAQAVFEQFWLRIRPLSVDEEGGRLAPMYGRAGHDHIWKIAGAFAFASPDAFDMKNGTGVYIGAQDMEAAIHIMDSCFQTFSKLTVTVAVDLGSKIEEQILGLLKVAGPGGCVHSSLLGRFPNIRKAAAQALLVLVSNGAVEPYSPKAALGQRKPLGRPATYYYLAQYGMEGRNTIQAAYEALHGLQSAEPESDVGTVRARTSKHHTVVVQNPSPHLSSKSEALPGRTPQMSLPEV